jgi:hypothetical protein
MRARLPAGGWRGMSSPDQDLMAIETCYRGEGFIIWKFWKMSDLLVRSIMLREREAEPYMASSGQKNRDR